MPEKNQKSVMAAFGTTIAEKRKLLGISQEKLAEQVGISQESLSRMEKGFIAPRFERLQLFADALECSIPDLFQSLGKASDRAATIERIISPLADNAQKEIIAIVAKMVHLYSNNDS